ncbi:MAG TPA: hypothetical protein ENK05_00175 [Gammaproteobacteria bacterium]|nr:hypothetical protein [Gammaproteobacteria bacterium]
MKHAKTLLASALLATAGAAQAELSANLGVVSNYYFRGISQTDDKAAVQGGIDYNHESGLYVGTWLSNVDFGGKENAEVDLYAGYGGDIGDSGFSYDVGTIYYWYPGAGGEAQGGDLDYAEVNASLGWNWLTGSVSYTYWSEVDSSNEPRTFNSGDVYYHLDVDPGWSYEGFSPTAFIGYYDFNDDGDGPNTEFNYTHWGIGVSKDAGDFGSLSVNYEQVDDTNDLVSSDSPKFWIGWTKDF